MYQLPFDQLLGYRDVLIEVPAWWFQAALAWLGVIGLLLWLFGRRLLQPGLGLLGLGVGALATLAAANTFGLENVTYWVIGGALGGALVLGMLLWRLVLALTVTAAVMIAAPWGVIAFNGWSTPSIGEPIVTAMTEIRKVVTGGGDNAESGAKDGSDQEESAAQTSEPEGTSSEAASSGESPSENEAGDGGDAQAEGEAESEGENSGKIPASISEPLQTARETVAENWNTWWWEDLSAKQRQSLLGACIGGGVMSFLLGLALPSFMASLVTALIGAGLIYTALIVLLPDGMSGMLAPSQPRRIIIGLLAATLLGMMLQTLLLRSKAET